MNTLELRKQKALLTMTRRQKEILTGMLLGDAHLERQRGAQTAQAQDRAFGKAIGLCRLEVRRMARLGPHASKDEGSTQSARYGFDKCGVCDPFTHRIRTSSVALLSGSPKGDSNRYRTHAAEHGRVVHGRWLTKVESVSRSVPQHAELHHRRGSTSSVGGSARRWSRDHSAKAARWLADLRAGALRVGDDCLYRERNTAEHEIQVAGLTECLKCNGGAQRFPQAGWQSAVECNGKRELDCETYKSSRCESRA